MNERSIRMVVNNVANINQDKIILTNLEVAHLLNQNPPVPWGTSTPISIAWDKMSRGARADGKLQVMIFKVLTKITALASGLDELRLKTCHKYADRDENGKVVLVPGPLQLNGKRTAKIQMSPENKAKFDIFYSVLLGAKKALPFHRIKVDATLLGRVNEALGERAITPREMIMLEKVFSFEG